MLYKKKISKNNWLFLLLIALWVLLPNDIVKAENESLNICHNGFMYKVFSESEISPDEYFTADYSLIHSDIKRQSLINGKIFSYQSLGEYNNNGDSKVSNRCYVVKDSSSVTSPDINVSYNGYTPKICGNQYSIADLNIAIETDENTGLITITITAKDLSDINDNTSIPAIKNAFKRLKVSSTTYYGINNQQDGKGKVSYDNGSKIIISGILPGKGYNNLTYTINLYIDEIKKSDFNEVNENEKSNYIKDCGGSDGGFYIGALTVAIPMEGNVKIKNPLLGSELCNNLNSINASDAIKKGFVTECFDKKISYGEKNKIEQSVREKITTLKKIYEGSKNVKGLADKKNLLCTDTELGIPSSQSGIGVQPFETKVTYENMGTYFGMICVESYYVDGGVPSLVKAGVKIDYENKVEVRKTCSIIQIGKVIKKPECRTSVSQATCLPATSALAVWFSGGKNGGPTNNFDNCVKACDGGKYTQSCINSCYKETYDNERSISLSSLLGPSASKLDFSSNFSYSATKIASNDIKVSDDNNVMTITWNDYTNGTVQLKNGYTLTVDPTIEHNGKSGNGGSIIKNDKGEIVFRNFYSQWCAKHHNPCTVTITSGPQGCVDNPDVSYRAELDKAKSELANLTSIAEEETGIKEYTISLKDTRTYDTYKISGSSYDTNVSYNEPRLVITKDKDESSYEKGTTQYIIGDMGDSVEGLSSYSLRTVYDINLPKTYSVIGKSDTVLIQDNADLNKFYTYNTNSTTKKDGISYFKFENYKKSNNEVISEGFNSYYTNRFSNNFNVIINSGKSEEELAKIDHHTLTYLDKEYIYELINRYENIEVSFIVGTDDSISDKDSKKNVVTFDKAGLKCYYGVFQVDFAPPDPINGGNGGNGSGDLDDPDNGKDLIGGESDPIIPSGSDGNGNGTKFGIRYYYREIKLTDVFPNDRNPRWNWTGTILSNGIVTGAANNTNKSYLVNPKQLIEEIEKKGNSIYSSDDEIDYSYTLTRSLINDIRRYNKTKVNSKKITYLDYSLADNTTNHTFSEKMKEWLPNLNTTSITDCNNAIGENCDN